MTLKQIRFVVLEMGRDITQVGLEQDTVGDKNGKDVEVERCRGQVVPLAIVLRVLLERIHEGAEKEWSRRTRGEEKR
jgi:hypothetical protein